MGTHPIFESDFDCLTGRRLFPQHPFPHRLSLQTAEAVVYYTNLPSQHQRKWQHMFGYTEISMVARPHNQQGTALNLLPAHRPKSRRSVGARDCTHVQNRPSKVFKTGARVDFKVRNVTCKSCLFEKKRENKNKIIYKMPFL